MTRLFLIYCSSCSSLASKVDLYTHSVDFAAGTLAALPNRALANFTSGFSSLGIASKNLETIVMPFEASPLPANTGSLFPRLKMIYTGAKALPAWTSSESSATHGDTGVQIFGNFSEDIGLCKTCLHEECEVLSQQTCPSAG